MSLLVCRRTGGSARMGPAGHGGIQSHPVAQLEWPGLLPRRAYRCAGARFVTEVRLLRWGVPVTTSEAHFVDFPEMQVLLLLGVWRMLSGVCEKGRDRVQPCVYAPLPAQRRRAVDAELRKRASSLVKLTIPV